jgi:hypothetical protein
LALSPDKNYVAVLSRQPGVYEYEQATGRLKPLIDAIDILDANNGKLVKSLPNLGENVVYSRFKDNNTLQLGLASGQLLDWSITSREKKVIADFAESMFSLDPVQGLYAYRAKNNIVRISNGQGDIQLSIENKKNPIQDARLLAGGKNLLTVLANGDLALWKSQQAKKCCVCFQANKTAGR